MSFGFLPVYSSRAAIAPIRNRREKRVPVSKLGTGPASSPTRLILPSSPIVAITSGNSLPPILSTARFTPREFKASFTLAGHSESSGLNANVAPALSSDVACPHCAIERPQCDPSPQPVAQPRRRHHLKHR